MVKVTHIQKVGQVSDRRCFDHAAGRRISVLQRLAAAGFASAVRREETMEEQSRKANARQFEQNYRRGSVKTFMERRKQQGAAGASGGKPPKSRAAPAAAPSPRDQRGARGRRHERQAAAADGRQPQGQALLGDAAADDGVHLMRGGAETPDNMDHGAHV